MSRKKHHKGHHEEHVDESWLIPYADILTLLLALFIVLFASAQVDQKKFDQLAQSFNMAFGGSPAILDSVRTPPNPSEAQPPQNPTTEGQKEQAHLQETVQLLEIKKQMDRYIQENNLNGDLQTVMTEEGLMIRIRESALFPSGSATLRPDSQRFGSEIAKMLMPLSQKVVISGHTDNMPINTYDFPSNWELSARRSINFMKFLLAQGKLPPERFSAIGYGEYRPVATNETEEGRSKNRRVEVLIMRNFRM